ncbi:MAG: D-alanyl-D-alanine carboxypeptidase [Clostridia bacterium]|nr:D-alanyl-D-alanine carboxypeptidase [Clostridia bacterium]
MIKRNNIVVFLLVLAVILFALQSKVNNASAITTSATGMVVIEKDSGRVLYASGEDKRLPMASTTKIATAITVIDNVKNLDVKVRIPRQAIGVEGSSIYLNDQDELSVRDLLYGLMLQSGNDCAVALALTVGGSISEFARLMNETAKKVGANDTNFTNPHGLDDKNHYTTALDLAKISAYALCNTEFAKIVSAKSYTMSWGGREYCRIINNKNKLLRSFDGANGVKTGYTKRAGRCLVSSATRNGMTVIAVVLNCSPMFEECATVMDKAFEEFALYDLSKLTVALKVSVMNGKEELVPLAVKDSAIYPLKKCELEKVTASVIDTKNMVAPVILGQENGKIRFFLENRLLFERKLYTIVSVERNGEQNALEKIVKNWLK